MRIYRANDKQAFLPLSSSPQKKISRTVGGFPPNLILAVTPNLSMYLNQSNTIMRCAKSNSCYGFLSPYYESKDFFSRKRKVMNRWVWRYSNVIQCLHVFTGKRLTLQLSATFFYLQCFTYFMLTQHSMFSEKTTLLLN